MGEWSNVVDGGGDDDDDMLKIGFMIISRREKQIAGDKIAHYILFEVQKWEWNMQNG